MNIELINNILLPFKIILDKHFGGCNKNQNLISLYVSMSLNEK